MHFGKDKKVDESKDDSKPKKKESSNGARVEPRKGKALDADPKKDYSKHPKFQKFSKGEVK